MFSFAEFEEVDDYAVALLGPLLNAYFAALHARCRDADVPCVGFISREGVFLKQAFDLFCAHRGLSQSTVHIPASRSFLTKLLLDDDVLRTIAQTPFKGSIRRLLEDRLAVHGFGADRAMENWLGLEIVLPRDLAELEAIWPTLRAADFFPDIARKKEGYRTALDELGFKPGGIIADVGYSGSMQGLLSGVLGVPIDGFYIATTRSRRAFPWPAGASDALFPELGEVSDGPPLLENSLLLEIAMSADHGQIDDYDDCAGHLPWRFHHGPKGHAQYSHPVIGMMHRAAIGYLIDTASVPLADLLRKDHQAWLYAYINRLMAMPRMAPRLLSAIGDVDDRSSSLGFINPWQYLPKFR